MEVEQTPAIGRGRPDVPVRSSASGVGPERLQGRADWRGDVALELWVEVDAEPVRIRMAGRLDASTVANLDDVVRELLDNGTRHIELCTDGLRVHDASAVGALADVERRVRAAGGTMERVDPPSGPSGRAVKPPPPALR
jgi:anti-anti-sigma factor